MLLVTGVGVALVVRWTAAADRASQRSIAPLPNSQTFAAPSVLGAESASALQGASKHSGAAAADPWQPPLPPRTWTSIVLHHSATRDGDVASIDAVHRQQKDTQGRPWLGIGYHFVIGNGRKMGDGEIQPTFRWLKQLAGAHAGRRDYNEHGIGICLIGNFDESAPTDKQQAAARDLVRQLAQRYQISRDRIVPHRDVQATACPGRLFPWEQLVADLPGPPDGS